MTFLRFSDVFLGGASHVSDPKQLLCNVDYQFVALTQRWISVLLVLCLTGRSTRDIVFLLSFMGLLCKSLVGDVPFSYFTKILVL